MNHSTACTLETNTLHLILQAIIIDGLQRARSEADILANAEAAVRALRAGLAAFTAAPKAVTGGGVNAALDVTHHFDGAKLCGVAESISNMSTLNCNGEGTKAACQCASVACAGGYSFGQVDAASPVRQNGL